MEVGIMSSRKPLTKDDSFHDFIQKITEGHSGARTVIENLVEEYGAAKSAEVILGLDDMNVRGTQIWAGYNQHCSENLETFVACVEEKRQDFVETINRIERASGRTERAVVQEKASDIEPLPTRTADEEKAKA